MTDVPRPGASYLGGGGCRFTVWVPDAQAVDVVLVSTADGPSARVVSLEPLPSGYHARTVENVAPGQRYKIRIAGSDIPDPASRSQPDGVHEASEVVDPSYDWKDGDWLGIPLRDYVLYELHVGTFTPNGTFDGVVEHIADLKEIGVTALELMPVAQFPGERNWGYDGVYPYAAQNSYGGLDGLRRLVDACHLNGIAVVLDVVYNHLGPEGNYVGNVGRYFTDLYNTPWGAAMNFDGPDSDGVRNYFIENALWWLSECHIDALRLDAVHSILDHTAYRFIEELGDRVASLALETGRNIYLIAESSDNDPRLIRERDRGGYGMNAVWADDFHHSLHTLLTGERDGYYANYGALEQLAKCYEQGFAYTGEYSGFRRRRHGASALGEPAERFVVFSQNHDQIGNRPFGERLTRLVGPEEQKLAAGACLLSPFIPLLFMGEEYGETAPFPYFIDHPDEDLNRAVREGRRREFNIEAASDELPDPSDPATFESAKLDRSSMPRRTTHAFYAELLRMRGRIRAIGMEDQRRVSVHDSANSIVVEYGSEALGATLVLCFSANDTEEINLGGVAGQVMLDSSGAQWGGPCQTPPLVRASSLTVRGRSVVLLGRALS